MQGSGIPSASLALTSTQHTLHVSGVSPFVTISTIILRCPSLFWLSLLGKDYAVPLCENDKQAHFMGMTCSPASQEGLLSLFKRRLGAMFLLAVS